MHFPTGTLHLGCSVLVSHVSFYIGIYFFRKFGCCIWWFLLLYILRRCMSLFASKLKKHKTCSEMHIHGLCLISFLFHYSVTTMIIHLLKRVTDDVGGMFIFRLSQDRQGCWILTLWASQAMMFCWLSNMHDGFSKYLLPDFILLYQDSYSNALHISYAVVTLNQSEWVDESDTGRQENKFVQL